MTDKEIKEILEKYPDAFKHEFEEYLKRPLSEDQLLKFKKLQEIEARKENLPEPEFTKTKKVVSISEESVCEDLDEAAKRYATEGDEISGLTIIQEEVDAFIAGANWQKQQIMKEAFVYEKKHDTAMVLASECLRNHGWFNREHDFNDLWQFICGVKELFAGEFNDNKKVKLIVIKED